jgi:hypothetical protein
MKDDTEHGEQAKWVVIATFSTGFEADMARQRLAAEGIPVLVESNAPGIFGASYQGAVTGGITLQVPSPVSEWAHSLLNDDAADFDDDDELSP